MIFVKIPGIVFKVLNLYVLLHNNIVTCFCLQPATGYGLDDQRVGFRVPVGARIFTPSCRPDRFWGPPSILFSGYRGLFPRG
jgi:hypothetical protein